MSLSLRIVLTVSAVSAAVVSGCTQEVDSGSDSDTAEVFVPLDPPAEPGFQVQRAD